VKADPQKVLTGTHQLTGNESCAEGALAAGCQFLGVYPIVPAQEVSARFLVRAKQAGATYIQMEDEISVLAAVLGASWTGKKSMTVTSGSGLSLMMEHLGLGVMLETPCVIVDVQSIGPGLGMPDCPAQADVMQSRWGSHGDYEIIALAPSSAQEMFDYMIKAFNYSEQYRVPVIVLSDAYLAQLQEKVVIPSADKITLTQRRYYDGPAGTYLPFKRDDDYVPPMVDIGQGHRFHVTGLTHDDRGYPIMNEECQEYNVHPLVWKIRKFADKITETEEIQCDDAEVVIVAYGSCARAAQQAVTQARSEGIKAGLLKLVTVWPFPEKHIAQLSKKIKAFVVPEMNFGQIVFEVERCSYGNANVGFVSHDGANVETPDTILAVIKSIINENIVKDGVIEYTGA
jgi:2-oxoglutarate ferredoxin oxidoreductase subunit alpha